MSDPMQGASTYKYQEVGQKGEDRLWIGDYPLHTGNKVLGSYVELCYQ